MATPTKPELDDGDAEANVALPLAPGLGLAFGASVLGEGMAGIMILSPSIMENMKTGKRKVETIQFKIMKIIPN